MYEGACLPVQGGEDGVGDGVVAGRHVVDPLGRGRLEDVEGSGNTRVRRYRRSADSQEANQTWNNIIVTLAFEISCRVVTRGGFTWHRIHSEVGGCRLRLGCQSRRHPSSRRQQTVVWLLLLPVR